MLVNLRNMNRVLEINHELAYAVVEPGLRWFDLADALLEAGGDLWTSLPDIGWGSPIGNAVENGVGFTPLGDHASNLCGLEVVLPDGEVIRTGFGAQTDNPSWHCYQHGIGPSISGLFRQSNFGIVTKEARGSTA